jgi:hypothetical protein
MRKKNHLFRWLFVCNTVFLIVGQGVAHAVHQAGHLITPSGSTSITSAVSYFSKTNKLVYLDGKKMPPVNVVLELIGLV